MIAAATRTLDLERPTGGSAESRSFVGLVVSPDLDSAIVRVANDERLCPRPRGSLTAA
jgi:hypothetical protein